MYTFRGSGKSIICIELVLYSYAILGLFGKKTGIYNYDSVETYQNITHILISWGAE